MKNKKGFTLVEVIISWVIITIIILNVAAFFLFAWKLKVQFEEDRAVLGILTSYIEAKKAQVIGTAVNREGNLFSNNPVSEIQYWKRYCIKMWDYTKSDERNNKVYPPLVYPLLSTKFDDGKIIINKNNHDDNKYVQIQYQWCQIEIKRIETTGDPDAPKPQYFLMPSVYVWCKAPNSDTKIGMQVTNSMPWRNYENGQLDNF